MNRPCIVFGRNQNPWLEINIARAQQGLVWNSADWLDYRTVYTSEEGEITSAQNGKAVALDLVRRRSGGGTVIHDAGNLNFSFIVPNDKDFTRNKHASLIVGALQSCLSQNGVLPAYYRVDDIYVNERHDIAMKLGDQAVKVSGSAFKLTKGRALHHGTLLLASPNILPRSKADVRQGQSTFSQLLSSPAKPFLDAKGVSSVSSPVHNLFDLGKISTAESLSVSRRQVISKTRAAIMDAFTSTNCAKDDLDIVTVGDEVAHGKSKVDDIHRDVQEMMTDAWRYGQTPSFLYRFSQGQTNISFQAKQTKISDAKLMEIGSPQAQDECFASLEGKLLHEIDSWQSYISPKIPHGKEILDHLCRTFPNVRISQNRGATSGPEITGKRTVELQDDKISSGDPVVVRRMLDQTTVEVEQDGSNTIVQRQKI